MKLKRALLFVLFVAAIPLAAVAGDMLNGAFLPDTLKGNYTFTGNNTFSGTTTISGATACTDTQTFAGEVHFNGSVSELGNSSGDAITVTGTMTAAELAGFTTGIKIGADPADAGAIRLSNAGYVFSEADAAGTDISVIGVDSSEVVQIGASGASGVTITPALTVTGGLTSPKINGHVTVTGTVPTASAGTIDTKSTDHVGRITSVGATKTIITFASAYTATPACVATASDAAVWIVGVSTTGFTPTAAGNIENVSYACFEML